MKSTGLHKQVHETYKRAAAGGELREAAKRLFSRWKGELRAMSQGSSKHEAAGKSMRDCIKMACSIADQGKDNGGNRGEEGDRSRYGKKRSRAT